MISDRTAASVRTRRRRFAAATALVPVIIAGLLVHAVVPGDVGDIAGDALYATLTALLLVLALPRARPRVIAIGAALVCAAVETLQLTTIPRALAEIFPPTALVLGSGFDARDLVVYTSAAVAVALVDHTVQARLRAAGGNTEGALPEESAF